MDTLYKTSSYIRENIEINKFLGGELASKEHNDLLDWMYNEQEITNCFMLQTQHC